jgi:hypothetical protein
MAFAASVHDTSKSPPRELGGLGVERLRLAADGAPG